MAATMTPQLYPPAIRCTILLARPVIPQHSNCVCRVLLPCVRRGTESQLSSAFSQKAAFSCSVFYFSFSFTTQVQFNQELVSALLYLYSLLVGESQCGLATYVRTYMVRPCLLFGRVYVSENYRRTFRQPRWSILCTVASGFAVLCGFFFALRVACISGLF